MGELGSRAECGRCGGNCGAKDINMNLKHYKRLRVGLLL